MSVKSNFTGQPIPNITTRKSSPITTNFANGIYTYKPNDTMKDYEIRLAQDARFDRVGEYGTRLGYQKLTDPIGKATIANNYDTNTNISADEANAYSFTASADATIYSVNITLSKDADSTNYVVPKVILAVNGEYASGSCANYKDLSSTATEFEVVFIDAPSVSNGDIITINIGAQTGQLSDFNIAVVSGDIIQCKVNSATAGAISNVFEANIDGDKSVLFVFNGTLYWLNSSGTVASIRTLPAGVNKVRFDQTGNKVRYADGMEAPHLLTPTISSGAVTSWADSVIATEDLETGVTLDIKTSNIAPGFNDNILYFDAETTTQMVWTYPYGFEWSKQPAFTTTATISGDVGDTLTINLSTISPAGIAVGDWITGQGTETAEVTAISGSTVSLIIVNTDPVAIGSYDQFNRKFRQNFPAIDTGDPLTAMINLGGVTFVFTKRNKYQMYSQTADAWTQSPTNAQGGTFSQESVVCDLNYAYFANENGVYVFDGASEASITEDSIQNVYDSIPNKESIVVDMYKNRLYIYYTDTPGEANNHCLIYNINLRVWESFDSNTFVSATSARQNTSSRFICGHSKFGMLMLNESTNNNDYSDLGEPIAFNLETGYLHFGTTSQYKRITKWRPEFAISEQPYTVECGYALDFTDQVKYAFSIDLQRQIPTLTNYVWDNPSDYGAPAIPTVHTTTPKVNGEFYRCQIRYQHIAAFEPVIFRSHTLTVQTQRIR